MIRARGIASNSPTSLLAYDNFEQEEGNLEGKALPLGGTWSEVNKTGESGFKVIAGSAQGRYAQRTKTGDSALNSGCFALAGTAERTDFSASVVVKGGTTMREGQSYIGILGRYASTTKYMAAVLFTRGTKICLKVFIKNGSEEVESATAYTGVGVTASNTSITSNQDVTVTLGVSSSGSWTASAGSASLVGTSTLLATGGALATGKVGLYDAYTVGTSGTRKVDSFAVLGLEATPIVCYAGKRIEFRSDGVERQDSSGTYYGQPSMVRGGNLYLAPAGDSGRINRLAVRMRRNDVEAEPDENVTDKHSVEVLVTERYLIPR